jgi:cyclic pyranopterin phosphate synthase
MMYWCADQGHDLTLIETMPLGETGEDRIDRYLPLDAVQQKLEQQFHLTPLMERTGGPARYWRVEELGLKLGLITPLTNNFCAGCNRVRVTVSGSIYMCLGHDDHLDLKTALREGGREALDAVLDRAMILKPERHDFAIRKDRVSSGATRHMSVTGG